jgi:hypothetical protein
MLESFQHWMFTHNSHEGEYYLNVVREFSFACNVYHITKKIALHFDCLVGGGGGRVCAVCYMTIMF